MDKQERGLLLVDQQELEKKINTIKEQLRNMGTKGKEFLDAVILNPEKVNFSMAPAEFDEFNVIPSDYLKARAYKWADIPEKKDIAKLIQDLRAAIDQLADINRKL